MEDIIFIEFQPALCVGKESILYPCKVYTAVNKLPRGKVLPWKNFVSCSIWSGV